MAMNDYNRSNPFVIIIEKQNNDMETDMMKLIKTCIISIIIGIVSTILFLIQSPNISVLLIILPMIYFSSIIRGTLNSTSRLQIKKMIYGNEFKDINVNNEKALDIIMSIMQIKGKVAHLSETLIAYSVINIILIIYLILSIFYQVLY